jgi:hypothetical protein
MQRRQKDISDEYSKRVVVLMNSAKAASSRTELEAIRRELLTILTSALADLDADRLSEESFHSFRSILQVGLEAVRDQRANFETSAREPETSAPWS